eukprot:929243_1
MAHPLVHLPAQQRHLEQFSLLAHQILKEASDIVFGSTGDKDNCIARLYKLQQAVEVHPFESDFLQAVVGDIEGVIGAVISAKVNDDNDEKNMQSIGHNDEMNNQTHEREDPIVDVGVVGGKQGRPWLDVSEEGQCEVR